MGLTETKINVLINEDVEMLPESSNIANVHLPGLTKDEEDKSCTSDNPRGMSEAPSILSYLRMVNTGYSDLNHQNVKSFFINLVTGYFVYMCHCKSQFYDKILKIDHKGQRSRSISIILTYQH